MIVEITPIHLEKSYSSPHNPIEIALAEMGWEAKVAPCEVLITGHVDGTTDSSLFQWITAYEDGYQVPTIQISADYSKEEVNWKIDTYFGWNLESAEKLKRINEIKIAKPDSNQHRITNEALGHVTRMVFDVNKRQMTPRSFASALQNLSTQLAVDIEVEIRLGASS